MSFLACVLVINHLYKSGKSTAFLVNFPSFSTRKDQTSQLNVCTHTHTHSCTVPVKSIHSPFLEVFLFELLLALIYGQPSDCSESVTGDWSINTPVTGRSGHCESVLLATAAQREQKNTSVKNTSWGMKQ